MENIKINGSTKTPEINLIANEGLIEIKGRSIPENSIDFYKPIIEWLTNYSSTPQNNTVVNIQLEYFNTASSKCILDVFKKLEVVKKSGNEITINWFYEEDDEDMLEAGEDYQSIIKIPFNMKQIEN